MIFSQICFAHIEDNIFVDIYEKKIATEMFDFRTGESIKVIVTESDVGNYWAVVDKDGKYNFISHYKEYTEKNLNLCNLNKEDTRSIVSVDVERWNK